MEALHAAYGGMPPPGYQYRNAYSLFCVHLAGSLAIQLLRVHSESEAESCTFTPGLAFEYGLRFFR